MPLGVGSHWISGQQARRVAFERAAIVVDTIEDRRRHREHEPRRVEPAFGKNVMDQIAVQPAVAVFERMNVDEAESERRGGEHRIEVGRRRRDRTPPDRRSEIAGPRDGR